MLEDYETKDVKNSKKKRASKKKTYNFPNHGVSVQASNLAEAKKLLTKQLNG